jgi:hypothetical protein
VPALVVLDNSDDMPGVDWRAPSGAPTAMTTVTCVTRPTARELWADFREPKVGDYSFVLHAEDCHFDVPDQKWAVLVNPYTRVLAAVWDLVKADIAIRPDRGPGLSLVKLFVHFAVDHTVAYKQLTRKG